MPTIIDVEVVIDTQTLLQSSYKPSNDPNNPTGLPHVGFAYMIAQPAFVSSGQASGNLSLNALVGDVIQWRMLSLSGNSGQAAVLYGVPQFAGIIVTGAVTGQIEQPYEPLATLQADGNNYNPPQYSTITANDYFLQADITGNGTEQYKVCFYITTPNAQTGQPTLAGYYYWDPTITVA